MFSFILESWTLSRDNPCHSTLTNLMVESTKSNKVWTLTSLDAKSSNGALSVKVKRDSIVNLLSIWCPILPLKTMIKTTTTFMPLLWFQFLWSQFSAVVAHVQLASWACQEKEKERKTSFLSSVWWPVKLLELLLFSALLDGQSITWMWRRRSLSLTTGLRVAPESTWPSNLRPMMILKLLEVWFAPHHGLPSGLSLCGLSFALLDVESHSLKDEL